MFGPGNTCPGPNVIPRDICDVPVASLALVAPRRQCMYLKVLMDPIHVNHVQHETFAQCMMNGIFRLTEASLDAFFWARFKLSTNFWWELLRRAAGPRWPESLFLHYLKYSCVCPTFRVSRRAFLLGLSP